MQPDLKERFRIYLIPEQLMVAVLNRFRGYDYFNAPMFEGIPEDAEVSSVMASWEYRGIMVRVHHPSFDVVPLGAAQRIYQLETLGKPMFLRVDNGKAVPCNPTPWPAAARSAAGR